MVLARLAFALVSLLPALSFASPALNPRACPTLPRPLPSAAALPNITDLPSPWTFFDGTRLKSQADWSCRRQELLTLTQEYLYGYYPDHSKEFVTANRTGDNITVTIRFGENITSFTSTLTMPTTRLAPGPVPVIINVGGVNESAFLDYGIALATFNSDDVAADSTTPGGAFWDLYSGRDIGVLTAWAWGYHRVLDSLLLKAPEIDPLRIGVNGCSRWGKAALAAGIFDERVFLSIPMSSGEEGIGPWRFFFEEFGANEMINNIFGGFPYWSTSRLGQFVNNSFQLPFDAHLEAALIAPRALIWDEGSIDYWTNPEGEASVTFPGTQAVYSWLGAKDNVGVAIRNSSHCDISGYTNVQDFMLKAFFGTPTTRNYSDISPYTPFTTAFQSWINDAPGRPLPLAPPSTSY